MEIRRYSLILFLLLIMANRGMLLSQDNYIVSVVPLDASSQIDFPDGKLPADNGVRTRTAIQYYDGLGRPVENIAYGITPQREDLVGVTQYNGLHRTDKQWLPVSLKTNGEFQNVSSVMTQAESSYSDARPFTEFGYESSALDRVTQRFRPGESWESHPSRTDCLLNGSSDKVRKYGVVSDGTIGVSIGECLQNNGEMYAVGSLYKTVTYDEDGIMLTTFTDKSGRKILERRIHDDKIMGATDVSDTYYVYDELGRLRYILPYGAPAGNSEMLKNNALKNFAYCYLYDDRDNLIYKRMPGCEPQFMVYDATNRLVLKQDGNQRQTNSWTLYAYDSIGRNLYEAEIQNNRTHSYLVSAFADKWQVEHFSNSRQPRYLGTTGYASTIMGNRDARIFTVRYYDTYNFLYLPLGAGVDRNELMYSPKSGYGIQHGSAVGLLTGMRIYNLSDNTYTTVAYYYDHNGRIIQKRGTRNFGGYDIVYIKYNFDGTIAQQLSECGTSDDITTEHYVYDYDHAGRVKSVSYQLNDDSDIVLCSYSYDESGRLKEKRRHNGGDVIRYSYDMRNSLTEIQSRVFSEKLFYADSIEAGVTARYNGNISAAYFTHAGVDHKFAYYYDDMNRFIESKIIIPSGKRNNEFVAYDSRGNIYFLQRYSEGRMIDDLEYTYGYYTGKLESIHDHVGCSHSYGVKEYHDHDNRGSVDMKYDSNGNLVYDTDRGIAQIKYNIFNLPDTIWFSNGNRIVNYYDAMGRKYRSIYYTVIQTAIVPVDEVVHYGFDSDLIDYRIIEYEGNIENVRNSMGDTIRRVYNPEGYVEGGVHHGIRDNNSVFWDPSYYYFHKDHLGNNCAVWSGSFNSVVQRMLYYPSGLPMSLSQEQSEQNRKYNGKEYIEAYGYDMYDYGFREYYATIGRFTSVDPLAEKYPHMSPYTYAGNNSISNIDYMGLMPFNTLVTKGQSDDHTVWRYTEINNDGIVTVHKDDVNDRRVMLVDGSFGKVEVGAEIDGEEYKVGNRAYIQMSTGVARKIYNSSKGISVTPYDSFDVRFGKWLRAKNVDEFEERDMKKMYSISCVVALSAWPVGLTNDIVTLTKGENIFGTQADKLDYVLSIVDIVTFGAHNMLPKSNIRDIIDKVGDAATYTSTVKTIQEEIKK